MGNTTPMESDAADMALVADRLAEIAHLADRGDLAEYAACFTEDVVWHMPEIAATGVAAEVVTGRGALVTAAHTRRAAGIQGPGTATRHVVSTAHVEVVGDVARATSYFRFYGDTSSAPRLLTMGCYTDRFERVGCAWLLAERWIEIG